jgi:hypothetical protein
MGSRPFLYAAINLEFPKNSPKISARSFISLPRATQPLRGEPPLRIEARGHNARVTRPRSANTFIFFAAHREHVKSPAYLLRYARARRRKGFDPLVAGAGFEPTTFGL